VVNPNIIESENLKEWLLTFDISNLVDVSVNVVQEVKFNIKTLNLNSVDKNDSYEYFKSKEFDSVKPKITRLLFLFFFILLVLSKFSCQFEKLIVLSSDETKLNLYCVHAL
jgi:hypothetical protein